MADQDIVRTGSRPVAMAPRSDLTAATVELLTAGVPENTRRAYARDRRSWSTYCAATDQPVLPVTADGIEPGTGLVTACQLTKATGAGSGDASVGVDLLTDETGQVEVLGDSAYATGEALATLTEAGHTPLVKPWPTRPAVPGGFTIQDFTVDLARPGRAGQRRAAAGDQHSVQTAGPGRLHQRHPTRLNARTVTCPAGNTVAINPTGAARFGSRCACCPLAAQCTTARRGRDVHVGENFRLQREHRQRAQGQQWQDDYRQHRPMVERSIAWLVARGNRKLRYQGVTKNNAWLHHRTAALNLRRMLNLGLIHHQGAWALA